MDAITLPKIEWFVIFLILLNFLSPKKLNFYIKNYLSEIESISAYVTAYRERDLSVIDLTLFENSLKINLSSKNYNNGSEVASKYELQFGLVIIFRTKIDF